MRPDIPTAKKEARKRLDLARSEFRRINREWTRAQDELFAADMAYREILD